MATKTRAKNRSDDDIRAWEDGSLGQSDEHVGVVDDANSAAIDDSLELQLISIRLPKGLLKTLKQIAAFHGIGYQPMVRDLMHRFAQNEMRTILEDQLKEIEKAALEEADSTEPVRSFMEQRKRA